MVLIQIILVCYCVIEAWLEYHIINVKCDTGRSYAYHDSWEHALSAVKYMFVVGALVMLTSLEAWPAAVAALPIRFVVFGGLLNIFRGKSFFYLRKQGIDGWLRYHLGEKAGQFAIVFCVFAIALINLFL